MGYLPGWSVNELTATRDQASPNAVLGELTKLAVTPVETRLNEWTMPMTLGYTLNGNCSGILITRGLRCDHE